MSYNQKTSASAGGGGGGGAGMSGGPSNASSHGQQVAKTFAAGIQQQMQNLVHGQNPLQQSSQADLNAFLQQQRIQNMLKQQQFLHFQQQMQQQQQQHHHHQQQHQQQQQQQHQQHQQQHHQQQQQLQQHAQHSHQHSHNMPGAGGVGGIIGPPVVGGSGGSVIPVGGGGSVGTEPLALTRTPGAAELLNKTYQQQANGNPAANPAFNQLQQQLQALSPNIMQQLQAIQYQMHNAKLQQQQQQQQQQHVQGVGGAVASGGTGGGNMNVPVVGGVGGSGVVSQVSSHGSQSHHQIQTASSNHLGHQQSPTQKLSGPQNTLSAVAGLQQFQQRYLTAAAQAAAVTGQKLNSTPPPPPPPPPLTNQLKSNLPNNSQLTSPVSVSLGISSLPVPPSVTSGSNNTLHQKSAVNVTMSGLVSPKTTQTNPPSLTVTTTKTTSVISLPATAHQQNKYSNSLPPSVISTKQQQMNTACASIATTVSPLLYGSNLPKSASLLPPTNTSTSPTVASSNSSLIKSNTNAESELSNTALGSPKSVAAPQTKLITSTEINDSGSITSNITHQNKRNAGSATVTLAVTTTSNTTSSSNKLPTTPATLSKEEVKVSEVYVKSKSDTEQKVAIKLSTETNSVSLVNSDTPSKNLSGENEANNDAANLNHSKDNVNKLSTNSVPVVGTKSSNGLKITQIKSTTTNDQTSPSKLNANILKDSDISPNGVNMTTSPTNGTIDNKVTLNDLNCIKVKKPPFLTNNVTTAFGIGKNAPQANTIVTEKTEDIKSKTITKVNDVQNDCKSKLIKNDNNKNCCNDNNINESIPTDMSISNKNNKDSSPICKSNENSLTVTGTSPVKGTNRTAIVAELKNSSNTLNSSLRTTNSTSFVRNDVETSKRNDSPSPRKLSKISTNKNEHLDQKNFMNKNASDMCLTKQTNDLVNNSGESSTINTTIITNVTTSTQSALNNNCTPQANKLTIGTKAKSNNSELKEHLTNKTDVLLNTPKNVNKSATNSSGGSSSSGNKKSGRPTKTKINDLLEEKSFVKNTSSIGVARVKRKLLNQNKAIDNNNYHDQRKEVSGTKSACADTPKTTSSADRKSQRHRLKTILYQSPLPELAYITKLSASEASNSPKPLSNEDRLIVFYKNEYMAVRNAEGTFYLCQTMQNVYRTSPRISIRWLSEDAKDANIYLPDFYDHTDIECVLTTVELKRIDKGHLRLPKNEKIRIENILKKALDVEKGLVPRPELLTEENPDGLDISLYKDESQIEKKLSVSNVTGGQTGGTNYLSPVRVRKSRRGMSNALSDLNSKTDIMNGTKKSVESSLINMSVEKNSKTSNIEKNISKRKRTTINVATTNTTAHNTINAITTIDNSDPNLLSSTIGVKTKSTCKIANARKRKVPIKRKRKSRKSLRSSTDEENGETTSDDDESDTDYKPNQKRATINSNISRNTPRAQRSPLAKARAASPIVPSMTRLKTSTNKMPGGETVTNTLSSSNTSSIGGIVHETIAGTTALPIIGTPSSSINRSERALKRKVNTDTSVITDEGNDNSTRRSDGTSTSKSTPTIVKLKETLVSNVVESDTVSKTPESPEKSTIAELITSNTNDNNCKNNNNNNGINVLATAVIASGGNRSTRSGRK